MGIVRRDLVLRFGQPFFGSLQAASKSDRVVVFGDPPGQFQQGLLAALIGGLEEPAQGLKLVLVRSHAIRVGDRQQVLGPRMPLGGGGLEPDQRFLHIAPDAVAVGIHEPDIELRLGIADPRIGDALLE